jgi:hypothetical protein
MENNDLLLYVHLMNFVLRTQVFVPFTYDAKSGYNSMTDVMTEIRNLSSYEIGLQVGTSDEMVSNERSPQKPKENIVIIKNNCLMGRQNKFI